MQIVIDIPEDEYKNIRECYEKNDIVEAIYSYIYYGTPLPEEHGRLIDADALLDKKQDYGEGQNTLILIDPYYVRKAPTIIEGSDAE